MKRKNTTRNALFTSIISLLLCVSMLVGTTFAWFTDEVKSGRNVIAAGNLDVELCHSDENETDVKVDGSTKLFNDVVLWEPGAVLFDTLQVKNVGTLALKYDLNLSVLNETVVNGYKLSDVIKVGVLDGALGAGTTRDGLIAAVSSWTPLKDFSMNKNAIALEVGGEDTFTLVLYWQPNSNEIDNRYNMNNENQGKKLELDIGVNLYATQVESESDSFDNTYDEDAYVEDAANLAEILISDNKNIVVALTTDVDLPITSLGSQTPGSGEYKLGGESTESIIIDLNGHMLNITTGYWSALGAVNPDATITIKNGTMVSTGNSAATWNANDLRFCNCNWVFENVTFNKEVALDNAGKTTTMKNVTINGTGDYYALWITSEGQNVTIDGLTVNSVGRGIKIDNQYVDTSSKVTLNVANATFTTAKKAAMVVKSPEGADITLSNVNINGVAADPFNEVWVDENAAAYADKVTVTGGKKVVEGSVEAPASAATNDALKNAIAGENTEIILAPGTYTLPTLTNEEGLTIVGAADGSTVIGGENTTTGFGSNFGKNTTIKNITFNGATNGVRYSYANGGNTTFDNCTFAGDTYGFHMDESNGATLIFNNCTFSGFNAFAGDLVKVVFNNCTFLHNGNYGHTNIWSTAEFNNCTFGDKASAGTRGDNAHLFFNGVEESYHHEYIGSAESLFAFAESVNEGGDSWNGQKVVLVAAIDLENQAWTPIGQTGATQFKGTFDGNGHTIKNLNIDSSAQTGANYSSGLFGWLNNAVVKNLTVENATVTGNHNVGVIAGYMETAGCTISNCHVINATVVAKHANNDACGDKVGVIVGHAGNAGVKVENCSAKDSTVTAGRDAGQIAGAALTANVVDCTATNVTVTASGDCTGANINNAIIGRVLG